MIDHNSPTLAVHALHLSAESIRAFRDVVGVHGNGTAPDYWGLFEKREAFLQCVAQIVGLDPRAVHAGLAARAGAGHRRALISSERRAGLLVR
jgi:hypothetical protein